MNGPYGARGRCRISPPHFLAECCKRRLNQGSYVSAVCLVFFDLYCFLWFILSFFLIICLSVAVKWLAGKSTSEMTYTVSGGVFCVATTLSMTGFDVQALSQRPRIWEVEKIGRSGHFVGTHIVNQHHLCNIPHVLSKRTCVSVCTVCNKTSLCTAFQKADTLKVKGLVIYIPPLNT